MKLAYKTQRYIRENSLIKEFLFLQAFKSKFINSFIYSDSMTALSKKMGWSTSKTRNALSKLLKLGWITKQHQPQATVFKLISNKELNALFSNSSKPFTQQTNSEEQLLANHLEKKIQQKAFIRNKLSDLQNPSEVATLKNAKKFFKNYPHGARKLNPITEQAFAIKTIANEWKCSTSKAGKLIRKTTNQRSKYGIIRKPNFICLGKGNNKAMKAIQESHPGAFLSQGKIWQRKPSIFLLTPNRAKKAKSFQDGYRIQIKPHTPSEQYI